MKKDENSSVEGVYSVSGSVTLKRKNLFGTTKDKTVDIPADVEKLFKKEKALVPFESLTFSVRKEYIQWIEAAKKEETRAKRIQQAIEKIKEKQGLNHKYKKSI